MTEEQRELRKKLRNRGWATGETPTGRGAFLRSPRTDWWDGEYHNQAFMHVEISRYNPKEINLEIFDRRLKGATCGVPWNEHTIPVYVTLGIKDMEMLVELMQCCIKEEKEKKAKSRRKRKGKEE